MDIIKHYRKILIKQTLIPYSHGNIEYETICDTESNRYLVVTLGRDDDKRRIHDCLLLEFGWFRCTSST